MEKRALITGITGQDGSYLAEFLLKKGYHVFGTIRRSSVFNTKRIDHIMNHPRLVTFHGDLCDSSNLNRILRKTKPNEIYNLGAQSHVAVSFDLPEYTAEVDALGTIRLLDAIRDTGLEVKLYQASTSELFGGMPGTAPQSEKTPFHPRSPYAAAKLYAYWMVKNYRDAYGLFTCNGILFNHESPRRGETFVSKKISKAVARISKGQQKTLVLGNLDAKRDWGYAPEYVECMWLMLQNDKADDFVVGSGSVHTVRSFVEKAFLEIDTTIIWKGDGIDEKGYDSKSGDVIVELDPRYIRPTEVDLLHADSNHAKLELGWTPKTSFDDLVKLMVKYDLEYDEYGFDKVYD